MYICVWIWFLLKNKNASGMIIERNWTEMKCGNSLSKEILSNFKNDDTVKLIFMENVLENNKFKGIYFRQEIYWMWMSHVSTSFANVNNISKKTATKSIDLLFLFHPIYSHGNTLEKFALWKYLQNILMNK